MRTGVPRNPDPPLNWMYSASFANPLNLDTDPTNAFYCLISGDTTLNVLNTNRGGKYLVELVMDSVGGHNISLGGMFSVSLTGSQVFDTTANAVNLVFIVKLHNDYLAYIIY